MTVITVEAAVVEVVVSFVVIVVFVVVVVVMMIGSGAEWNELENDSTHIRWLCDAAKIQQGSVNLFL